MKPSQKRKQTKGGGGYHGNFPDEVTANGTYGDSGGPSRFFYVAKASKSEKEFGLEGFEPQTVNDGRKKDIDNAYQRGKTERKNTHKTVKPIALMRHLCKLVKMPGDPVLIDPFTGSGSTGIAAIIEGFQYIGVEQSRESFDIACARIDSWTKQQRLF